MSAQFPNNPNSSTRERTYREIGVLILAMPIPLGPLVALWVYADGGDWVWKGQPDMKQGVVFLFFQLQWVSLASITTFLGLLMFYLGEYRRRLIAWLLFLSILPAVLGFIVTGSSIYFFFLFAE